MKPFRRLGFGVALSLAACGGGGTHLTPSAYAGGAEAPGAQPTASGGTVAMSIVVTRPAASSSSATRTALAIPSSANSVDAEIYAGTAISGSAVATSCVAFPANATSATLTIVAPQGQETIAIAAWGGSCSGSGGQGSTGTGTILSSFTGTGTVTATSTTLAAVFNSGNAIALGGSGAQLNGPLTYPWNPHNTWLPTSLANVLEYPVQSGYNGGGETVAIVITSAVSQTDLNTYFSYNGTPTTGRTITFKSVDNASLTPGGSGQGEATLDTETVAGLAPGANVVVYVMPDLSDVSVTDAYDLVESDGLANVVTSSFGGYESGWSIAGLDSILATGATAKIAFLGSAGDQGSACYLNTNTNHPGVEFPASDPNVIAVAGTESWDSTHHIYSLTNPVAWNDNFFGYPSATGGGVSGYFTSLPIYQVGVAGLVSASARNVPDVALPAVGTAIFLQGTWQNWGGTSWSSPLFAAQLAEIYQYCKTAFANPVQLPYKVFAQVPSAFVDVTSGNNDYTYHLVGTPLQYDAAAGYDNASGVGIPLGLVFAQTLCPNRVPAVFAGASAAAQANLGAATPILVPANLAALGADQGQRSASEMVGVQIVLRSTPLSRPASRW